MLNSIFLLNALNLTSSRSAASECALRLAKGLNINRIVYVVDNFEDLVDLEGSLLRYNLKTKYVKRYFTYDGIVMDVQSFEELYSFLDENYNYLSWNKSAKVVAINVDTSALEMVLKIYAQFYILSLLVITSDLQIRSYKRNCDSLVLSEVIECNNSNLQFKYRSWKFKKCDVKVASARLPPYVINEFDAANPGSEVLMMREIAVRIGVYMEYVEHNYTNHGGRVNGSYSGLYKLLNEKRIDVVMGAVKAEDYLVEVFDGSQCFSLMQMGLFVRSAKLQPVSSRILQVFQPSLWLVITFTVIIIVSIFYNFNLLKKQKCDLICVITLILNIAFSSYSLKSKYAFINSIYFIWSFTSFFIITLFTNTFMTFLAIPSFEKQLNTLDDIINSGLQVGGYIVTRHIAMDQNSTFDVVYKNWVSCSLTGEECLQRVLDGEMAIIKNSKSTYYIIGSLNKKTLYRCSILTYNLVWLMMRKGLPIAAQVDQLILRMMQGGILEKWERDTMMVNKGDAIQHKQGTRAVPGFFLWSGGLVTAAIAFLVEIVLHRRKSRLS